jgi:TonB family protein
MVDEHLRAFFSYSRADSEFALRLAKDLRAAGAIVWLDQLDIHAGERWDRSVEDALAKCPTMVVILSPSSVSSTNVMDEVSFALEEQKTVIPVLYQECKIPFRLRRLQYMDCRSDYPGALKSLVELLGAHETPAGAAAPDSPNVAPVGSVITAEPDPPHAAPVALSASTAHSDPSNAAPTGLSGAAAQFDSPHEAPADLSAAAAHMPDSDQPHFAARQAPQQHFPVPHPDTPVARLSDEVHGDQPKEGMSRPRDFSETAGRHQPNEPSTIQSARNADSFASDYQSALVAERGNPKTRLYVGIGAAAILAVVLLLAVWPHNGASVTPRDSNDNRSAASSVSGTGQPPLRPDGEEKSAAALSAGNPPATDRPAQSPPADTASSKEGAQAPPDPQPPKPKTSTAKPANPAPTQAAPTRIRVGGRVMAVKLVTQIPPDYPSIAKQARVQGVVKLQVIVAADGTVEEINTIDGHPFLVPAAIAAVKKWVYAPTILNGKPVGVETTVDVIFTLNQ